MTDSMMFIQARTAIINAFAVDRGVSYPRTRSALMTVSRAVSVASGEGWNAYVQAVFSIDDDRESITVPRTAGEYNTIGTSCNCFAPASVGRLLLQGCKLCGVGLDLPQGGHGVVHPLAACPEDAFVEPHSLVLAGALSLR